MMISLQGLIKRRCLCMYVDVCRLCVVTSNERVSEHAKQYSVNLRMSSCTFLAWTWLEIMLIISLLLRLLLSCFLVVFGNPQCGRILRCRRHRIFLENHVLATHHGFTTNGATITTATAVGTIQNDDEGTSVTLASNYSGVSENGKTNLVYNFTRSGATTNSLTVNFTLGGTATRGNDYNAYGGNFVSPTTGNIVFASGQTTAQIEIVTTGDTVKEANETIAFTLASGTGYTIGTPGAVTTTILNDDGVLNQQGTTGNDVIEAGTTRNLSGRAGHDILIGSNASDMLVGAAGNDTMQEGPVIRDQEQAGGVPVQPPDAGERGRPAPPA